MNLTWIDGLIVAAVLLFMMGSVFATRSYMRSVSDFLAAGRTGGRYLICVSQGIAMLGAITVVANFEMYYQSGFAMVWWNFSMAVVVLIVSASGWVVYRFRRTRAMTMAQFFETRYSRNFRIFAGALAFLSGIVNFGIFPAVGARFFIHYCGLPAELHVAGADLSTFVVLMAGLLAVSLFFVFTGGQVAVIVADFLQGTFVNVVIVVMAVLLLALFPPHRIFEALSTAPPDRSLINPFHTGQARDFNVWFFLIGVVGFIYNMLSWQGTQAYNTSAKSAHEAKMGQVLSNWRVVPQVVFMLLAAVCAYTVMHHPAYEADARGVQAVLDTVEGAAVRSQLTVPLVLARVLPVGLLGAFAAVMLAAFISTHDTYLHSWGSILVQDVILPLRKKPLDPKRHIFWLRLSILGVAVFIFCFSLLFRQSEYILLFFAITGAIYAGGSGAVIIGGLYWKRGTTPAAWTAMITGSFVSVLGILLQQVTAHSTLFHALSLANAELHRLTGRGAPPVEVMERLGAINGQVYWFIAIAASLALYALVSLLGPRREFDMDRLLHRGKYRIEGEYEEVSPAPAGRLRFLGVDREFTRGDKLIYLVTYAWIFAWFAVFAAGTAAELFTDIPDETWMDFWYVFILLNVAASVIVTLWFTLGGVRDLKYMFRRLDTMTRDHGDDGRVR